MHIFENRQQAGSLLGKKLSLYKSRKPMILAISRGGVPVGYEVAKMLDAPLDVIVARKLGSPINKEFAFGAIASGDVVVIDRTIQESLKITETEANAIVKSEMKEMEGKMIFYSGGSYIQHRKESETAIIVDDGLSTGLTARAAIEAVKMLYDPQTIIFAAPVCARDTERMISGLIYTTVTINSPKHLFSIGNWYEDFKEVTDQDVVQHLKLAADRFEIVRPRIYA